jgi:hypothetical protein
MEDSEHLLLHPDHEPSVYAYISPSRFITGVFVSEYPRVLFNYDNSVLILPTGSCALMVNFQVDGSFATVKGRRNVLNLIARAKPDVLHFISALKDPSLLGTVDVIFGCTNKEMAHVVVKKLGFRYAAYANNASSYSYTQLRESPMCFVAAGRNDIISHEHVIIGLGL